MNRNPTLGAIATTVALLSAAAGASAHTVALDASCTIDEAGRPLIAPTYTFTGFLLDRDSIANTSEIIDGVHQGSGNVRIRPTAAAPVAVIGSRQQEVGFGVHTVTVEAHWTLPEHAGRLERTLTVDCGPAPAPTPTPTPTPDPYAGPQAGGPPPPVVITPGGVTTKPTVRPRPRPRYRCATTLLPSKSWQRIIFRRHGVRCPIRNPRVPVHIAVAGERRT